MADVGRLRNVRDDCGNYYRFLSREQPFRGCRSSSHSSRRAGINKAMRLTAGSEGSCYIYGNTLTPNANSDKTTQDVISRPSAQSICSLQVGFLSALGLSGEFSNGAFIFRCAQDDSVGVSCIVSVTLRLRICHQDLFFLFNSNTDG